MTNRCVWCNDRNVTVYTSELSQDHKTMEYLCMSCYTQRKPEGKKLMKFNKFDLEAKALKKEQERQSNAINYSDELVTLLFNPRPTEEARKNGTK